MTELPIPQTPEEETEVTVTVSAVSETIFDDIKVHKKYRYAIFLISADNEIDVEIYGSRDKIYEDFLDDIQKNGKRTCRYGLYDYEYIDAFESMEKRRRMIALVWCPYLANSMELSLYSIAFSALSKYLTDDHLVVHAMLDEELTRANVNEKLQIIEFFRQRTIRANSRNNRL